MTTYTYQQGDPGQWIYNSAGTPVGITDAKGANHFFSGLGTNLITVGSGGRHRTIQHALDFIATQPAFTAVTVPQGTVTASVWNHASSTVTISGMTAMSAYLPSIDTLRFQLAGDSTYYPVDNATGWGAGSGSMTSGIPRIESSIVASKSISWFRENIFTIVLLDAYVAEDVTISTDCCVSFRGAGKTLWRGHITKGAGFVNGRLDFTGIDTTGSGTTGSFINDAAGVVANTIRVTGEVVGINHEGDDWIYPGTKLGSLRLKKLYIAQQPSMVNGNAICGAYGGDVVLEDVTWNINPFTGLAAALTNALLVDKISGRNLVVRRVDVHLNDPHAGISDVAVVGEPSGDAVTFTGKAIVDGVSIACVDATTANLQPVLLSSTVSIPEIDIDNCGVCAPNSTGAINLVRAATNPPVATTVKIGRGNSVIKASAQANITYTRTAPDVSGTGLIAAGTSTTITHGLGYAPLSSDIHITPTLVAGSVTYSINSITATTFIVTLSASGTFGFDWSINP